MKPFSSPSVCVIAARICDLSPTPNMAPVAPLSSFALPSVVHTSTHQRGLTELISSAVSDAAKFTCF